MRPIDADQLKELLLHERDAIPKTIQERYGFGVGRPNNHGNSMRGGIRKALRCMEQCITINPEDLRTKGKWLRMTEPMVCYDEDCIKCSVCGDLWVSNDGTELPDWKYCPNCGARMEDNDETD